VIKAFAQKIKPLDILHFDAHPDMYDEFNDDPYSHACPFARVLEEGLARHIVQVGIRAANSAQREKAEKFGVQWIEMKDLLKKTSLEFSNPLYISFDVDALDPAFAPGVSHCEPGGLSTRQVINMIHKLNAEIVGMDVVEVNPDKDISGITASAAVKVTMEVMGRVVQSLQVKQV
jgi:agmatinase